MEISRQFSDTELLYQLRSGSRLNEAIQFIYRSHFDSLAWFIMNNNGSRQDAEDIFQEVVISFIESVQENRFRGDSSIRTFLFSLNRHAWLNELKRRGRALQREIKYESAKDREEADTSSAIIDREGRKQVMELVEKLGDTCKKILVMFYYENRAIKEMLRDLAYENEQVIRNKKSKCLKQLEQMIQSDPSLLKTLKSLFHE